MRQKENDSSLQFNLQSVSQPFPTSVDVRRRRLHLKIISIRWATHISQSTVKLDWISAFFLLFWIDISAYLSVWAEESRLERQKRHRHQVKNFAFEGQVILILNSLCVHCFIIIIDQTFFGAYLFVETNDFSIVPFLLPYLLVDHRHCWILFAALPLLASQFEQESAR